MARYPLPGSRKPLMAMANQEWMPHMLDCPEQREQREQEEQREHVQELPRCHRHHHRRWPTQHFELRPASLLCRLEAGQRPSEELGPNLVVPDRREEAWPATLGAMLF